MRELTERVYFLLSFALGKALRAGRYSIVRIVNRDGSLEVRKQRLPYAPLLVALGEPLVRVLDTGVRVLRQREWQERERQLYHTLYGEEIRIADDGSLILPHLPGKTLAELLEEPALGQPVRIKAIKSAVDALLGFHHAGFTHGDAMAENVMVDLDADVARWFDFETVHDSNRPLVWRRADDLRALTTTCLLRTALERQAEALQLILDAYGDEEVTRLMAEGLTAVWRRALTFHLGQAPLSWRSWRELERLVSDRSRK